MAHDHSQRPRLRRNKGGKGAPTSPAAPNLDSSSAFPSLGGMGSSSRANFNLDVQAVARLPKVKVCKEKMVFTDDDIADTRRE